MHLEQDVAASHKLPLEVDLRDRGPVGEDFDSWKQRENLRIQREWTTVDQHGNLDFNTFRDGIDLF